MHGNWRTKVLLSYTLNPTRNLCDLSVGYYIVLHQQMSSCSWVNWWLHLHPTLIALKLELNYFMTQYWFTIIIMRLELGLKCSLEFRTSGMLHRGVSLSGPITGYREANENSKEDDLYTGGRWSGRVRPPIWLWPDTSPFGFRQHHLTRKLDAELVVHISIEMPKGKMPVIVYKSGLIYLLSRT